MATIMLRMPVDGEPKALYENLATSEGVNGNTSVLFSQDGWVTTDESFPFIAYSWAQILPRLKKLVEAGERDPFFNF